MKATILLLLGLTFFGSQLVHLPLLKAQTSTEGKSAPEAVTLLQQAVNAAGGGKAPPPFSSITAEGTVVYNWGENGTEGSAHLTWNTKEGMVLESDTAVGKRTLNASAYEGTIVDERGISTPIGSHTSSRMQLEYFPALELAYVLNNPTAVIQGGSEVQLSNAAADGILVSHFWPSNGTDADSETVVFYLDPTTHLVVRRDDYVEMSASGPGRLTREIDYGGYKEFNGVLLPTTVSESLNGQPLYSITWSQLTAQ